MAYSDVRTVRQDARATETQVTAANQQMKAAATPAQAQVAEKVYTEKVIELQSKRAEARVHESEYEVRAAEAEQRSSSTPEQAVKAEVRKAVAEYKLADAELSKADAAVDEAKLEVANAQDDQARQTANAKLSQAVEHRQNATLRKAEVAVAKATAELKQVEAEAKVNDVGEVKAALEVKTAVVKAKVAEAEIKSAEIAIRRSTNPAEQSAAKERLANAEIAKSEAEVKIADALVRHAEEIAQKSGSAITKSNVEVKKAELEVRIATAELQQANRESKNSGDSSAGREKIVAGELKLAKSEVALAKANAEQAKVAYEAQPSKTAVAADAVKVAEASAEVKQARAEVKQAELKLSLAKDPESGVQARASLDAAKSELLTAEAKSALAEAQLAKSQSQEAKSSETKFVAEKRAEVYQAIAQAKQAAAKGQNEEAKSLEDAAGKKGQEYVRAKDVRDGRAVETYFGIDLASLSKDGVKEVMAVRHEYMKEKLTPALSLLKADNGVANLPICKEGVSSVCIGQVSLAETGLRKLAEVGATAPLDGAVPKTAYLPEIRNKVAIVIGNNSYQDENIPSLNGAINDADAVGAMLKQNMGYEVRTVHNGTKAEIVRQLNSIAAETNSTDSVIVYYAGHGYELEETGSGYWIPSDASSYSPENWISNSDVNKLLLNIPAKQMILVSDSCYSGTLAKEQKVNASDVSAGSAHNILGKRSVLVMTSGGEEPVVDEGREGHSVFAWHLMDKLKNVEQYKNGAEVYGAVREAVAGDGVPQVPQYGASLSAGHNPGGDYFFEVRRY